MLQQIDEYIWSYNPSDDTEPRSVWRRFLQIIVMVGRDLLSGMITLHAMSLVYTTLLSMVPLLAVSVSVLKGFGVHGQLQPALAEMLAPLGSESVELSERIVGFVENMQIGVLGAVGLAMLIFTAVSLIQKVEAAFNYTWRLQSSRGLMQRFSDYLSVIMVGPVLVFSAVGITASLANHQIVEVVNTLPYMGDVLFALGKLVPFLLVIGAFTFIYMLVPNTRVHLRSALYGAVIAGFLWQVSGMVFTSFVGGSGKYTAIYSGFAVMLVFMIWLYLSWVILLIGASISFYHQHPDQLKWKHSNMYLSARLRDQLALQVMVSIARAYDQQSELEPSLENLAADQQVPALVLERMLQALQDDGLLTQTADSPPRYVPAAALQRIRLVDILTSARLAEDDGQSDSLRSDTEVTRLLQSLQQQLEVQLGDETLADFLHKVEANPHEIVSFNVNSVRQRLHQLQSVIDKHAPEFIGLQETKVQDHEFPLEAIESMGYQVVYAGQKTHYGVAMLSRKPCANPCYGFPNDAADSQKRFIGGEFEVEGERMIVFNGYFPQGESRDHPIKFPAKQRFYADLIELLGGYDMSQSKLVVMGDYNIAPADTDIGIGDDNAKRWLKTGKSSFLPEEREWFQQLTALGLHDGFRLCHPEEDALFSWFDYRSRGFEREPKRGLRIDHLLVSELLQPTVVDAGVDYDIRGMDKPSDHAPTWIELDLGRGS